MECVGVGRDLVRLLQSVARLRFRSAIELLLITDLCFRIPEFMALWKDIIQNPQNLSPHFSGWVVSCM